MKLFDGMAEIEEDTLDLHDARDTFQTLRASQFAANMKPLLGTHRDQLKPEVIWNIEKGLALSRQDVEKAQAARGALFHRVTAFLPELRLAGLSYGLGPSIRRGYPLPGGDRGCGAGELRRLAAADLRSDTYGLPCDIRAVWFYGVGVAGRAPDRRPAEGRGPDALSGGPVRAGCGSDVEGAD